MVDVASFSLILPPPHWPQHLDSGPSTRVHTAWCPSPLLRDVGPIANAPSPLKIPATTPPLPQGMWAACLFTLDGVIGGDGEWEIRGGTQVLGGPSSASWKWATMKIVVCFHLFPFLSTSNHHSIQPQGVEFINSGKYNPTTVNGAQQWRGGGQRQWTYPTTANDSKPNPMATNTTQWRWNQPNHGECNPKAVNTTT